MGKQGDRFIFQFNSGLGTTRDINDLNSVGGLDAVFVSTGSCTCCRSPAGTACRRQPHLLTRIAVGSRARVRLGDAAQQERRPAWLERTSNQVPDRFLRRYLHQCGPLEARHRRPAFGGAAVCVQARAAAAVSCRIRHLRAATAVLDQGPIEPRLRSRHARMPVNWGAVRVAFVSVGSDSPAKFGGRVAAGHPRTRKGG